MTFEQQSPPASKTLPRRFRRVCWQIVRLPLIAYLVLLVIMMFMENRLIFHPFAYPAGKWKPTGLSFEDAWIQAADGTRLHGWYAPRSGPHATVLFCHGNAGNVTHRADTMQTLHNRVGASVLVFDYRGFGRSQGSPNGENVLADARAARKWLAHREKIPEGDIVMMGESIGGAVAVDLAACDGARALVLERTFDDLGNVAAHHCPWLPVRWLMRTRLDSASLIGQYHGPLLQVHGDADPVVPLRFGRRLFDTANEPKQFMLLRDFDHDLPLPPKYYDALKAFLDKAMNHQPASVGL